MTDKARKEAALHLRELLDNGVERKLAFLEVQRAMMARYRRAKVDRATLYRWCDRFGVSTR